MLNVFGLKISSSEGIREGLDLKGSKWCEKVGIKDLLRMAFPSLDANQIKKVLLSFIDTGKFSIPPSPPKAIYENYCAEFGCSFPFDVNGQVLSEQKPVAQQQKQQLQVMNTQQNEEYSQIKNALLNEIAIIQDTKNYTNDNGEIDTQKADMLFKRAEAVNNLAGSLNDMRKTEIESKRVQLDAVKTALSNGYEVKVNGNLLGVEIGYNR